MSMTKQSSKTSSFSVRDILDLETSKAKAKETTEKIAETKPEVKPDLVQTSQSPAAKLAPASQHLSTSATALSEYLASKQQFHQFSQWSGFSPFLSHHHTKCKFLANKIDLVFTFYFSR